MTNKSKSYIAMTFFILGAVVCLSMLDDRDASKGPGDSKEIQSTPSDLSANARTPAAIKEKTSAPLAEIKDQGRDDVDQNAQAINQKSSPNVVVPISSDAIFQDLLSKNPDMARLWNNTAPIGISEPAMMARKWIAMGLVIAPNQSEGRLLNDLIGEMNRDPQSVFQALDAQDPLLEQDPFIEQISLSLVHNLKVEPAQKAAFYTKVIERIYEFSSDGNVSIKVANSTNAFIYLRETGVPSDHLTPMFLRTLHLNRHSPLATAEIKARIYGYFPDARL